MSDILTRFFKTSHEKLLSTKNKDCLKQNLLNCGLFLSESNVLKVKNDNHFYFPRTTKRTFQNLSKKNKISVTELSTQKNTSKDFSITSKELPTITKKLKISFTPNRTTSNLQHRTTKFDKKACINSLINNLLNKKKSPLKKTKNKIYTKIEKKKIYPINKSIDPKNYIKYNFALNPSNKKCFKSVDLQIKTLGNKPNFRNDIIKTINENQYNFIFFGKLVQKTADSSNKIYENLIKENENKLMFMKKNEKILKRKDYSLNGKIEKNINSTKDYQKRVNKNQKEYLSFDEKIKSFLESAKATKNYINKFSAIHKEMIMKINDVKKYEKMSRNPGQKMNEN